MERSLFNPPANNRQNMFLDNESEEDSEMEIEGISGRFQQQQVMTQPQGQNRAQSSYSQVTTFLSQQQERQAHIAMLQAQITKPNQALRTKNKKHDPAKDLHAYSQLIHGLIHSLTNLTHTHSAHFYSKQQQEVMQMLKQAFLKHENNSMLLLARSKQTLHAFISAVQEECQKLFQQESAIELLELKVIRVNSILSNSETKILQRLSEALKIPQQQGEDKASFHSIEMVDSIRSYFMKRQNQAVLFVLEDIDYYVETTKQLLLYKILDMFTYLSQDWNVRFVFLATSVKVDIVDSFEKRIKSRFSHRLVLFYDQELSKFMEILQSVFNQQLQNVASDYQRQQINSLQAVLNCEETINALTYEYECGKNYDYLAHMLRIALSALDLQIQKKIHAPPEEQVQASKLQEFLKTSYLEALIQFGQLKNQAEPVKVLEGLPKNSLIVLIVAKKVGEKTPIFNYEAVHNKYRAFVKTHLAYATLSKQVFLKLFVDLIHQGFLKSEGGSSEVLNVNNKICLGFRDRELTKMIEGSKEKLGLPSVFLTWALFQGGA